MKILLVEDDEQIAEALEQVLTDKQHYIVDAVGDGELAWQLIESSAYDLIVLDIMLPKLDGISLCRRLRRNGHKTPVLMLTARDGSSDRVMGLDVGADDYVIKPFDLPELLARIRALMRRGSTSQTPLLETNGLSLNPSNCQVTYQGQPLNLTPKEYGLLDLLLRHKGQVLSRATIIDHLWSLDDPPMEETVKVHLKALRRKLRAAGAPANLIEGVYGLGYRLKQN
ncbi:MAG TPA: DNA-binding response regulator [Oscillatoriales bacterium UBA8482]|nr:MAG: DNA-binding response regulator [Oscillatoriales cyanobacterium CG2_30_40_61]HBW57775.1 DNA-binding response regulator [Oscillatoriales bacterium UBA8482]